MSLLQVECLYVTEEAIKELKNGNLNFKFPNSAPVLRFLYELCWTMVIYSYNLFFSSGNVNIYLLASFGAFMKPFGDQVRGDLPFQKCKAALEAVEFSDCGSEEEIGSNFADIVAQIAQDVSLKIYFLFLYSLACRMEMDKDFVRDSVQF